MSRCFPYPPPGYTLSGYSEAALIESIKLQKERENEQRKKDRKSEKRYKRTEKDRKGLDTKGKLVDNGFKPETESLERSGVTMEHKQPMSLHVPTSSSESTENSNNRKRPLSLVSSQPQSSGKKIVRIRLTKKRSASDSLVNEEQVCSTSGKVAEPFLEKPCSTSGEMEEPFLDRNKGEPIIGLREDLRRPAKISQRLHFKTRGEQESSISHQIGTANAVKVESGATTFPQKLRTEAEEISSVLHQIKAADAVKTPFLDSATRKQHKAYLKYTNLFENGVPPPMEDHSGADMDWLFQSKKKEECHQPEKRHEPTLPCSVSWPRAHYLPEIDLYALPYTVPF